MAQKVGSLAGYEIVFIGSSTIITNIDVYKEVTFPIQDDVTYKADPDYFVSAPFFSSNIVVISGPGKEIARIKKVSAEYDMRETLTQSKNFTTDLVLYDAHKERLSADKLNTSVKLADVNITVLARRAMKLSSIFIGKPVGLAFSSVVQGIDPETAEAAGPEDVLINMSELSLGVIDFLKSSIGNQNLQVDITLPSGYKNLSNIYTAPTTLDFNGFKSKKINVTDFQVKSLAANKSTQVFIKSPAMTLTGPTRQIDVVTVADVYAQINMASKRSFIGHSEFPVILVVKSHTSVWVYGEYKVNVSVTEENG